MDRKDIAGVRSSRAKRTTDCGGGAPPAKRGWAWLLKPDGTPAMGKMPAISGKPTPPKTKVSVATKAKEEPIPSSATSAAGHTNPPRKKAVVPITAKTRPIPSNFQSSAIDIKSYGATKAKRKPTERQKLGNWAWLLAPDGSFATIDTSTSVRRKKATTKDILPRRTTKAYRHARKTQEQSEMKQTAAIGEKRKRNPPLVIPQRRLRSSRKAAAVAVDSAENDGNSAENDGNSTENDGNSSEQPMDCKQIDALDNTGTSDSNYDGNDEDDQVDLLNSIGFAWNSFGDSLGHSWIENYQLLVEYKNNYGTTIVSSKHPALLCWVNHQRSSCKDQSRIDLFNKIGFEWDPNRAEWMKRYQQLVEYKKKYGTTCVKSNPQLELWACTQRWSCKEKHQIDLLNAIGFFSA